MSAVLAVRGLSVALPHGGDRALAVEDVSFDLTRGEILAVVGASGSGKSALASAIMGALPGRLRLAGGSMRLAGRELAGLPEREWRQLRGDRIALVPQEPIASLNPVMTVGAQIGEVFALHTGMSAADRKRRVAEALAALAFADVARTAASYPHQLSGGECQRIAIAMSLAMNPDVLIADEPTSALDVTTQAQILGLIRALKGRGDNGVLFITHDFAVVREIADRVAVMEAGRLVEIGTASEVLERPRHAYTRALIEAVPRLAPRPARAAEPPVLEAEGLAKRYGARAALARVDFAVPRGGTLAIVGESGSGKSTLARVLMRVVPADAGVARIEGVDLLALPRRRLRRARAAMQMVFQDPWGAINPRRRVGPLIARAAQLGGLARPAAEARARELLDLVGLGAEAYGRWPGHFSGGQRQRIGIARALAMNPKVLIADESVSALDVLVQRQVLDLLADLQARMGVAMLFITHDLRMAAALGDEIAVMQAGRIVERGAAAALLAAPRTDYARALIAAIPGRSERERALSGG